ncbi:MAG: ArsB/NhaD family transporter [Gammaproteobacteria bacterium]|nr:ArsB/NhaD family transporter [Gammaproteobacteria bacterium]
MTFSSPMIISTVILLAAYYLIFTETIHRTSAAIIGAVTMIGIGMWFDFYSQEEAIQAIDANTILLLAAMMMVVSMLRSTGAFEYTAIFISRISKCQPRRLLIYLCLAVSLISMILDNVTTVIVFAPLTILITRIMKINPMPYLVGEAMLSNVGGIATLVGDPPNIMIGSAANIDFTTFLVHMFPPVAVVWCFTIVFLLFTFRKELDVEITPLDEQYLDSRQAITDYVAFSKMVLALTTIIILFFIHHHFHFYPSYAAFIGLALAMALLQPKPENLFGEVNWSVLIFFAGLFVIVGGVEASGLLSMFGDQLAQVAKDPSMLLMTCILIMWVAALLSAFVDNIPFTVTMIPIILGLESSGVNVTPLWWALALGVGLGGNGTHIGATANIIVISELEKSGIKDARISPVQWLKKGAPATVTGLCVSSVLFTIFFDFFHG